MIAKAGKGRHWCASLPCLDRPRIRIKQSVVKTLLSYHNFWFLTTTTILVMTSPFMNTQRTTAVLFKLSGVLNFVAGLT